MTNISQFKQYCKVQKNLPYLSSAITTTIEKRSLTNFSFIIHNNTALHDTKLLKFEKIFIPRDIVALTNNRKRNQRQIFHIRY